MQWATRGVPANNTVRQRFSAARSLLRWCVTEGHFGRNVADDVARSLRRAYPATYGKQQGTHPPRWLTEDECSRLIAACQDGTPGGMRDETVVRLGLLGIRAAEVAALRVGHYETSTGAFRWLGKGRRPRRATAGTALRAVLAHYLATYEAATGRTLLPSDPLICRRNRGNGSGVQWGQGLTARNSVFVIVRRRASLSGLGHVAPHDLRRTAAGVLHRARGADGGHRYDLLDIQKVLGHADPATTMRSYLDPMDSEVIDRAGDTLDF